MAQIGCLGDVIFEVSKDKVLTPKSIQWNSGASWESHDRHMKEPMLEYTGMEADQMSLTIRLSVFQGINPMEQITTLFAYERNGTLLPLVIGDHAYGKYRWVIKSTNRELQTFDGDGNLLEAEIQLELEGYVK